LDAYGDVHDRSPLPGAWRETVTYRPERSHQRDPQRYCECRIVHSRRHGVSLPSPHRRRWRCEPRWSGRRKVSTVCAPPLTPVLGTVVSGMKSAWPPALIPRFHLDTILFCRPVKHRRPWKRASRLPPRPIRGAPRHQGTFPVKTHYPSSLPRWRPARLLPRSPKDINIWPQLGPARSNARR